jgi:hypothetical protein
MNGKKYEPYLNNTDHKHVGWTKEPPILTSASPIGSPQSEKSRRRKLGMLCGTDCFEQAGNSEEPNKEFH